MRVAFVIERYWPLMTAAGWVLDPVLRYLRQQGHEAFVLTAQVDRLWPETLTVRDVPLRRFGHDAWNLFCRQSLGQRIAKWLLANPDAWDAVVVWEPVEGGEHLWQVARSLSRPCVWNFCEGGPDSRLGEWLAWGVPNPSVANPSVANPSEAPGRPSSLHRPAWLANEYWVVPDPLAARAIRDFNPEAKVDCWSLGLPEVECLAAAPRRSIRAALSGWQVSGGLAQQQPLVVFHGHGMVGQDSRWLWQLLRRLTERRAGLTVWVLGAGSAWHGLWRSAMESGLEDRIVFPGDFGDLTDVMLAADLVLLPQTQRWLTYPWLLTVACGTPCLVAPTDGVVETIQRVSGERWGRDPRWSNVLPRDLESWVAAAEVMLDQSEPNPAWLQWQRTALWEGQGQPASLREFEQRLLQWLGREVRQ